MHINLYPSHSLNLELYDEIEITQPDGSNINFVVISISKTINFDDTKSFGYYLQDFESFSLLHKTKRDEE